MASCLPIGKLTCPSFTGPTGAEIKPMTSPSTLWWMLASIGPCCALWMRTSAAMQRHLQQLLISQQALPVWQLANRKLQARAVWRLLGSLYVVPGKHLWPQRPGGALNDLHQHGGRRRRHLCRRRAGFERRQREPGKALGALGLRHGRSKRAVSEC